MKRMIACLVLLGSTLGCGGKEMSPPTPPEGMKGGNMHPVLIVAHKDGSFGGCDTVDQPSASIHVKRGDTVIFEFRNRCTSDETFQVLDPDKIFGDTPPPSVPVGNRSTQYQTLTISDKAAYGQHKANIKFKGKDYDPRFEIDPGS